MKNSEIFWNNLVIIIELMVGLIWFYGNFIEFSMGILMVHSIAFASYIFDEEAPTPFLYISFLGVLFLVFGGIILGFIWLHKIYNDKNLGVIDKIDKFNNFLNRKNKLK